MPVYLCRPGHASSEPWRHGVQVYAYPFRIDGSTPAAAGSAETVAGAGPPAPPGATTASVAATSTPGSEASPSAAVFFPEGAGGGRRGGTNGPGSGNPLLRRRRQSASTSGTTGTAATPTTGAPALSEPSRAATAAAVASADQLSGSDQNQQQQQQPPSVYAEVTHRAASAGVGVAVRRVRHAEVVLADEVSASYGRYWLRLRWPGPRGGVAGYIALGVVPSSVGADESNAKSVGVGAGSNDAGTDLTNSASSSAGTGTSMAGALSGEREFRYRALMSEVSDAGGPSRNDSMHDQDENDINDTNNTANVAAAAAAAEAARVAISGALSPSSVDTSAPGRGRAASSSEPNSGAATPTAMAASSPTGGSPADVYQPPKCERTGLYFPSSAAMELLSMYDDGLIPPSRARADSGDSDGEGGGAGGGEERHHNLGEQIGGIFHPHHHVEGDGSTGFSGENDPGTGGEPVFCRICREGLHDVNYDLDSVNEGGGDGRNTSSNFQAGIVVPPPPPHPETGQQGAAAGGRQNPPDPPGELATQQAQQPLVPPSAEVAAVAAAATKASAIVAHHPSAENPLLAPCLCTGSMAFVHYLCVEQWRCRSRHPAAKGGLNCETCGGAYTLPPPPTRPAAGAGDNADWLEAMPAHVLAALRRPHPWWQIGTAIVRRRWLRPFAPIIMSPIVALYCRARRMLKKRGVSRRRWACSLCRRRARWKCVRCLRSYYCSRQCQNVSWHIVHKHLCYKPARFWWSFAFYGAAAVLAFPGILRDPIIYDLGFSCLLGSFVVMGVIGGSIATALKHGAGVDIRGRTLELTVVVLTLWMAAISWGLVWGFFGETSKCWGAFSGISSLFLNGDGAGDITGADRVDESLIADDPIDNDVIAQFWFALLFRPGKIMVRGLDKAVARSGPLVTRFFCDTDMTAENNLVGGSGQEASVNGARTCLRIARNADPKFYLPEHGGDKCASDIHTVTSVLLFAGAIMAVGTVIKRRERQRRNAAAGAARAAALGRAVRHEREGVRPHQD